MKKRIFMTLMSLFVLSALLIAACGKKEDGKASSVVETISEDASSADKKPAAGIADAAADSADAGSTDTAGSPEKAAESGSSASASASSAESKEGVNDASLLTKAEEAAQAMEKKVKKTGPGRRVYTDPVITEIAAGTASSSSSASAAQAAPAAPSKLVVLPATGNAANSSIAFKVDMEIEEAPVLYSAGFARTEKQIEEQLDELASYWEKYHLDSVDYLVRLPRFRFISQQLAGTNDYYYSGEALPDGTPNGKGVAVYADNCYYYGSFVNGRREGDGTWIQIFTRGGAYSKKNNGIYYHSYAGSFKNDLPDGEGQEHISHDPLYQTRRIATNVIGGFKAGYYHGEEYVLTVDTDGSQKDWTGNAVNGQWQAAADDYQRRTDGEMPVVRNLNEPGDYIWMTAANNQKQGVTGLTY